MSNDNHFDPGGEPSLAGIIAQMMQGGQFMADGWGAIDNPGAAIAKNRDDMRDALKRENRIIYETFSTAAGQQCLELLLDRTMRRSSYPAEMQFGMDVLTAIGIAREAQNSMVAAIIEAYAAAIEEETKPREQT